MSFQPIYPIQDCELQLEEHGSQKIYWSMGSSHLELYHCSSNNSNGGHFAEWTYCKHNGCTQSAAMARGVQKHKWGLGYYISIFPSSPSLCYLCTHAHNMQSLSTSLCLFQVQFFRTIYSEVHRLQLLLASLSLLTFRQCSSCSSFTLLHQHVSDSCSVPIFNPISPN